MSDKIAEFRELLDGRLARVGLTLSAGDSARLERYYRLLIKWNARINLTSLDLEGAPAATLDRLFVEPLIAAEFVSDTPQTWFDLGSGGGSPAIPLKVVRPAPKLTMVDSTSKKGVFLREACRAAELVDVRMTTARIQDLPALHGRQAVDLITIRAVRIDLPVIKAANYLLKVGGRLLHFASNVDTLPAGFYPLARRELTSPDDSLMVFERR